MNASIRTVLILAAVLGLGGLAAAKPWWMRGIDSNENDFLPPDVAFRVSSRIDHNLLRVRWIIADGYYLYRHSMSIQAESPDLVVSAASFPAGTLKSDPYLGTQMTYTHWVEGTVAYSRSDAGAHPMQIKVTYQGCAEAGLCYPPITKVLFPEVAASPPPASSHSWEGVAIIGGLLAFLLAGLLLQKGRRLDTPAT